MRPAADRSTLVTVTVASSAASLALVPAFLLGASAPFLREELDVGAGSLGLAVSAYWLAMALSGVPGGRLVHRWGAVSCLRLGVLLSCLALVVVASAPSVPVVFAGSALAGVASAVITPATDVVVVSRVPPHRLGLAFGVKQSSLPAASLLAGLGIPAVALTVGWRWSFVAVTVLAVPTLALVRRSWGVWTAAPRSDAPSRTTSRGLPALVVGMGLAMAAVSASGAFYVGSATGRGFAVGTAGALLAAGSALGVLGRFLLTWRLSSHADPFAISAGLVAAGAVGILGVARADSVPALALATLLALGAGWGWNGLFTHAVVAADRSRAARASSLLVVAAATGGVVGPATFGLVATSLGTDLAWNLVATQLLVAAVLWVASTRSPRPASGAAGT